MSQAQAQQQAVAGVQDSNLKKVGNLFAILQEDIQVHLMEEYIIDNPNAISEPDFQEELFEEIKDIFYLQFEEQILQQEYLGDLICRRLVGQPKRCDDSHHLLFLNQFLVVP